MNGADAWVARRVERVVGRAGGIEPSMGRLKCPRPAANSCVLRNLAQRFVQKPCHGCGWAIIGVLSHFQQAFRAAFKSCLANLRVSPEPAPQPRVPEAWSDPLRAREELPPGRPPTQRRMHCCPVAVADRDTPRPSGQEPRLPTSKASLLRQARTTGQHQGPIRRTFRHLQGLQPPHSPAATTIRLPGMKTCTRFRRNPAGPARRRHQRGRA